MFLLLNFVLFVIFVVRSNWLDLNHLNFNAVAALGHRFDAVDDRGAVVIPIGKPHGSHGRSLAES